EFYTRASNMEMSYLTESDKRFLKLIEQRPYAVREASEVTEIPYDRFCLKDLESEGYVTRIGVTPTDILAAEGAYKEYDTAASRKAVELLAKKAEMDMDTFIAKTKEAIVHKICRCIMDHIIRAETGKDELSKSDEAMIEEVLCQRKEYDVGFRLKMPIVGIGAPVGAWLPKVAETLNTELILPENYDVGNAIGAISSSVTEVVELSVRAAFQDFSDDPECTVYNGEEAFDFSDKDEALEFAVEEATRIATARAIESGAAEVSIEKKIDQMLIDVEGNGKKVFRGATVIVRASGKPMMHWFD
ncbi:MAG: hydantoinase/oxoprolinase family protein, partial [Candidatus Methanomethylophilaceae archaeon]|nr:hydantoinase/oxoprolinase family protein [Candidatus Methanomethylophilaceae archaeon]